MDMEVMEVKALLLMTNIDGQSQNRIEGGDYYGREWRGVWRTSLYYPTSKAQ